MPSKTCCRGRGKTAAMIIGFILLAGIAAISILRDRIVNYPQYQVSVVGQGKITYTPDIANITIGVQVDKALKAQDALKQMTDKANKVIAAIKADGIADADIQTQNYSLNPQVDYTSGVASTTGYNANEQVLVKVRDIKTSVDKLNKVIADASAAGANQILGISFDVADIEGLKQQARILAIKDAQRKAVDLAGAANVKLGDIVGWWENVVSAPMAKSDAYGMGGGMMTNAAPVTPNIQTGSQDVIIEMNLSYRLK